MKIVIKRGSHMGGPLGEAPRSEADKLFIYFYGNYILDSRNQDK